MRILSREMLITFYFKPDLYHARIDKSSQVEVDSSSAVPLRSSLEDWPPIYD
jgi:hypothetical protein